MVATERPTKPVTQRSFSDPYMVKIFKPCVTYFIREEKRIKQTNDLQKNRVRIEYPQKWRSDEQAPPKVPKKMDLWTLHQLDLYTNK